MTPVVIIPSKTLSNLVPCLQAVRKHEPDARVIVVDDGIDLEELNQEFPMQLNWLWVVNGIKPFVFAKNVNLGIREAGTDSVVILNDDALLESPGGFSLLAREAEAHPEYGIIGVTTNLTGQPLQLLCNIGLREVPHIAFVGVYIPRRTLETVGLLDERYCEDYGCEDLDYCEAVRRAGLKIGVHDGCYVDHGSLWSTFRGDPRQPKSFAKNLALFKAKCAYCDRTGERFTAGAGMVVCA